VKVLAERIETTQSVATIIEGDEMDIADNIANMTEEEAEKLLYGLSED
jgi:hypothetical protein